jgi:N-acyl-D-aspartate/D-glutamate deacylase
MTLLIKNARILGGDRKIEELSDVFISKDRISAIGSFSNKTAVTVLDAQGSYLTPGFINTNSASDHFFTLFEYPSQDDFLKQGVTTILGGMSGSSLAPLFYGNLKSIRKWTDNNKLNVNWRTVDEFLKALDKNHIGVNFGTMVGHDTVRREIIGDSLRNITKNEFDVFSNILKNSLKDGAFGFSTGLNYVHERGTPYSEIKSLSENVVKNKSVYATTLRDSVSLLDSINEVIKLAKETGVTIVINDFMPIIGQEKEYERALETIENIPKDLNIYFDISFSDKMLIPFYKFLPIWAQTGGWEVMLQNIKDEWYFKKVAKEMPYIDENNFIVAQAPENDFLVSKKLSEIKEMYELKDPREALLHFMIAMDLRGVALYKNVNEELLIKAIKSDKSLIASDTPSFKETKKERKLRFEEMGNAFTKFIFGAEKEGAQELEKAVEKVTKTPAKIFNISERGVIKEGNFADFVCFKDGVIKFVIVNGKVVIKGGEFQNILSGVAIRHKIS